MSFKHRKPEGGSGRWFVAGNGLRFFMLVLLVLMQAGRSAAAKSMVPLENDTLRIEVRRFNGEALNRYRRNSDFNYSEGGGNVSPSLWQRFWLWLWSLFRNVSAPGSASFWKYLMIILISGIIIFVIVKLSGMDATFAFSRRSGSVVIPYDEQQEDIHVISFDEEIEWALANHDYRLAVRFLYLKSLKWLSDTGRIRWEPEKTNLDYVNELKHTQQKQNFARLTREFEYVWYGSFPLDVSAFNRIRQDFADFNQGGRR